MATKEATKPALDLSGQDGNAFFILARAHKSAKRAGWTDAQWKKVEDEAKSGDYDHLLQTMMANFETT